MTQNKVFGIDLGTTNSCIAVVQGGKAEVVPNINGERTTPSAVFYMDPQRKDYGHSAKRQAIIAGGAVITSHKRIMGIAFDSEITKKHKEKTAYTIFKDEKGRAAIEIHCKDGSKIRKTPQEISADFLGFLKESIMKYYNMPKDAKPRVVITVPAYFDNTQKEATKDAGEIAGLTVERIINEPTAAGLAYFHNNLSHDKTVAVYDLGGGTFDISILSVRTIDGKMVAEVEATAGNAFLGGDDVDNAIVDHLKSIIKSECSSVDSSKPNVVQQIKQAAEEAKKALAYKESASIHLPNLYFNKDTQEFYHFSYELSLGKLNELAQPIVNKTEESCNKVIGDVREKNGEVKIDQVLLVGGSTRLKIVKDTVKRIFGHEVEILSDANPDEIVACGAAIQGAIIAKDITDIVAVDVAPLSFGIETAGGVFTKIIEKNSTIPTKSSQVFSTADNNQTQVGINVYQGERPIASDNKLLGNFILDGIPSAPRGVPQIEVTFAIDVNGILEVTAVDKGTSKKQNIIINSKSMDDAEKERLIREAEENRDLDAKRLELVKAISDAEDKIRESKNMISEYESKIDHSIKQELEDNIKDVEVMVSEVREDQKNKNISEIDISPLKSKTEALLSTMMKIGQKVYSDKSTGTDKESDQEANNTNES